MEKENLLISGKAKSVFSTNNAEKLILEFRDDTSAFDGQKIEKLNRKGEINNKFNAHIMAYLEKSFIPTHFEKVISKTESIVKRLKMFPIECVVRNISAGSLCKRLGVEEGMELTPPVFEFFLKNDALHDPMINEYHIKSFNWATESDIESMKELTFNVNSVLTQTFKEIDLLLVDYKLEFGKFKGQVILGDEFTPDGCRLWDMHTRKKLDKDRFRFGMGDVIEAYEEVARRLGVEL